MVMDVFWRRDNKCMHMAQVCFMSVVVTVLLKIVGF